MDAKKRERRKNIKKNKIRSLSEKIIKYINALMSKENYLCLEKVILTKNNQKF